MIFIFLILSLLVIRPYFHQGVPYTHDGENHLVRFAQYKQALREGQFPPRFAPNLLNHFGYPVFNYNYPLANILSLPLSILKVHYQLSFKLLMWSFVLLGLWGANLWLKSLKFKIRPRILALLVWSLNPYLLNLIFFRGNIGELMSLCLLPWLFYGVELIKTKPFKFNSQNWLSLIVPQTAFLLAHNVSVLFGVPLLIIYAVLRFGKTTTAYVKFFISWLIAIGLSLWFWLPAFLEKNQIILDQADLSKDFLNHFPTLKELLFSPLQFGLSYPGSVDSLSLAIGLSGVLVLVVSGILIIKDLKKERSWLGLWVLALGAVVLQLGWTAWLWQIVPLANFIQFPWRLSLFLSSLLLPLTALVWQKLVKHKWLKVSLLAVIILQLVGSLRLTPLEYVNRSKIEYELHPGTTSTSNENLPKSFTFEYFQAGDWLPQPQILEGDTEAKVLVQNWTGSDHQYQITLAKKTLLVEPTANFLGWQTKIKGESGWQKIEYVDDEVIRGRIAYWLESSEYQVETRFTQQTPARIIGNLVSGLTLLGVFGWLILKHESKK